MQIKTIPRYQFSLNRLAKIQKLTIDSVSEPIKNRFLIMAGGVAEWYTTSGEKLRNSKH